MTDEQKTPDLVESIRLWIGSRNDTTKAGLMVLTDLVDQLEAALAAERQKAVELKERLSWLETLDPEVCKACASCAENIASLEQELAEFREGYVPSKTHKEAIERLVSLTAELAEAKETHIMDRELLAEIDMSNLKNLTAENERLRAEVDHLKKVMDIRSMHEANDFKRIKALESAFREAESHGALWGAKEWNEWMFGMVKPLISPQAPNVMPLKALEEIEPNTPVEIDENGYVKKIPKGDSAGPEIKPPELVNDHAKIRFAEQAVIEAARKLIPQLQKPVKGYGMETALPECYNFDSEYADLFDAIKVLDRARGEGKSDGH